MKCLPRYCFVGLLLLGGCESATENSSAGIEGTGDRVTLASAYGTVSGFGSIYVNGVHFDTDSAQVQIGGELATEAALAVGMVVEILGEIGADGVSGVAQRINAERTLIGIVDEVVDAGRGRRALSVLGQMVYINEDATFVGTSFSDIGPGTGVSVSGFLTRDGLINATYVAQQQIDIATDSVQVEGYINSVNQEADRFTLKHLTVEYSRAEFIKGSPQDLAADQRVRVVGFVSAEPQTLQASRIEWVVREVQEDRYASLEGVVRDFVVGSGFTLRDTWVDLQNAVIESGAAQDILNGAQVVAIGPVMAGVMQAERIHIKPFNTTRFRGMISDIDAANRTFDLIDTTFQVTQFTQFKDDSPTMERYFNFASLRTGEEVDVFAVNVGGAWQVTRILRREGPVGGPPDFVRGQPTRWEDGQGFYIANLYIDASALPENEWEALREYQGEELEVEVEGFYSGDSRFRATHVRIRPNMPCNPHVFFDCEQGKPLVTPPVPREAIEEMGGRREGDSLQKSPW